MADSKLKRFWKIVGASLLLLAGVWVAFDEISFRHGATHESATVREWESKRWFGFDGLARVEFDQAKSSTHAYHFPVKTRFWYRPAPGDRIALLSNSAGDLRVDSLLQGFLGSILMILGSIAYFRDVVIESGNQKANEKIGASNENK